MMRKFLSATAAAALVCGTITPAAAQSYGLSSTQAPVGTTLTVNLKVPLGFAPVKESKPSYGLTLGYGQRLDSLTADGRIATRDAKLADVRFTDSFKLAKAEVMTFDLANLDDDRRLNMGPEGGDNTTWIIIGIVAAGVAVCLLADCFGDDDDDDDDDDTD